MKYNFEFNLTSFCQAKCISCARTINEGKFTPTHYPFETFKKTLENLSSVRMERIVLCGEYGDPMMHPEIEDFIELATGKGYIVEIMTNGGLRNPAFYKKWASNKRLEIFFCIDGIDHETNWKYREGVDFKKSWENMITWFSNGGIGMWEMLLFTWNVHQIEEAKQLATENRITINFKINTRSGFPGVIESPHREVLIEKLKTL